MSDQPTGRISRHPLQGRSPHGGRPAEASSPCTQETELVQNTHETMTYAALMQDKEILDELTALRQCVLITFILT